VRFRCDQIPQITTNDPSYRSVTAQRFRPWLLRFSRWPYTVGYDDISHKPRTSIIHSMHVPQHRIDYSELTSEHPLFLPISAIKCLYMRARRFNLTISQRAVLAICTESPTRAILPTAASEGYSYEARTNLPCIQHSYTYNTIINDSIRTQNLHLLQKAIHTYTVVIIHLLHEQSIQ
jgi:hypothetical protein